MSVIFWAVGSSMASPDVLPRLLGSETVPIAGPTGIGSHKMGASRPWALADPGNAAQSGIGEGKAGPEFSKERET